MPNLLYAVIALKSNEVDQVVKELDRLELKAIAEWLKLKKDSFYGKTNEDWKPFNGQTIDELINKTGYSRQTNLIEKFNVEKKNYSVVDPVRVYFIDPFALFLDKYNKLTSKIDSRLAKDNNCCLIMSYELPKDIQDSLLGTYSDVMSQVYEKYRGGFLHRIAMRVDDLENFRNYLFDTFGKDDRPSDSSENQIKKRKVGSYETTTIET